MSANLKTDRLSGKKTRMSRIRNRLMVLATVGCLIVLSACSLLPKEEETLAPPLVQPAEVQYDTAKVEAGDIVKQITGLATFKATEIIELSFHESGGRIEKINVRNGDEVEKGDTLIELETGDLRYRVQQSEIEMKKAKLKLNQLQEKGAGNYAVQIAKLNVESAEIQLNQLRAKVEAARITSPIDGIVTHLTEKHRGNKVGAYETLVQIVDPDELRLIYTSANGDTLAGVHLGMAATVKVNGETLKGKVVQTPHHIPSNLPKEMKELFQRSVLIGLDPLPNGVSMGDSADIEIITKKKNNTLIIPRRGLRSYNGRDYVEVLDGKTKREVDVKTGIVSATKVEILKGLEQGDVVILK